MRTLWNELSLLRLVPRAELDCSYGGTNLQRYYNNVDHVVRFLRGLNDLFSGVQSQIMLLQPLLDIVAFNMVLQ